MSAGIPSSSSLSAASILPPATSASVPQNTYHQDFTPYSAVSNYSSWSWWLKAFLRS